MIRLPGLFPDLDALASLLNLLKPLDYFVTVDHSVLWQRHVAWAKPQGDELREYVTQRFSSNMVVLSLMLGAIIGVFFDSSDEPSEIRRILGTREYLCIKYWIGMVMALDAIVTLLAIVTTFQAWGMVSAISDTNTHALLRSSIGQYVISLPPRLVVAALYLFVLWLTLFLVDFLTGSPQILFVLVVVFLFFQVIIPLSAFGRLIIHTGAMAKRRVLDAELEKELLPSGLHASLLIRATDRRRQYTNPIHQYKRKMFTMQLNHQQDEEEEQSRNEREPDKVARRQHPLAYPKMFQKKPSIFERTSTRATEPLISDDSEDSENDDEDDDDHDFKAWMAQANRGGNIRGSFVSRGSMVSHGTANSGEQRYPPASFLNSATNVELMAVVNEITTPSSGSERSDRAKVSIPLGFNGTLPLLSVERRDEEAQDIANLNTALPDVQEDNEPGILKVGSDITEETGLNLHPKRTRISPNRLEAQEAAPLKAPAVFDRSDDENSLESLAAAAATVLVPTPVVINTMEGIPKSRRRRRRSVKSRSEHSPTSAHRRTVSELSSNRRRRRSLFNKKTAEEWAIEDEVRNMYDVEPPAELLEEEPRRRRMSLAGLFGKSFRRLQEEIDDGDAASLDLDEVCVVPDRTPLLCSSMPHMRYDGVQHRLKEVV